MSARFTCCLIALFVLAGFAAAGHAEESTLEIVNGTSWDIHHLFLSPVDDDAWGPDQLGDKVLGSGESFRLRGIPCDTFDIKIIDEDGDECVVVEVDLCAEDAVWELTDDDLLDCES